MIWPDRSVIPQPLHIVPHAIAVDEAGARRFGDHHHPTIHMGRHASQHVLGRRTEPLWPMRAHQVMVAANAPRGDDHRLCSQLKFADNQARGSPSACLLTGLQNGTLYPIDDATVANACMRYIPRSHLLGHLTYRLCENDEANVLNQTVVGADQLGNPVDVELEAGEMSLHSDLLLHGSEANQPLALSVVGGLTSSTILSLFLVPVMFLFFAKRPAPEEDHEAEHAHAPVGA